MLHRTVEGNFDRNFIFWVMIFWKIRNFLKTPGLKVTLFWNSNLKGKETPYGAGTTGSVSGDPENPIYSPIASKPVVVGLISTFRLRRNVDKKNVPFLNPNVIRVYDTFFGVYALPKAAHKPPDPKLCNRNPWTFRNTLLKFQIDRIRLSIFFKFLKNRGCRWSPKRLPRPLPMFDLVFLH